MRVFLPLIVIVVLVVYALVDCIRTPEDELPAGMPKMLWIILVVIFPPFGAVAWIIASRLSRRTRTAGSRPGLWSAPGQSRPTRPRGPVAPDDDPEFLARLERERRRAERERRAREQRAEEPVAEDSGNGQPPSPSGENDETPGASSADEGPDPTRS